MKSGTTAWRAIQARATYANVMSTLAVVIMLGGGTAYATASIVDRAKLANNALALGGIKAAGYQQDVSTSSSGKPVKAPAGIWVTVLAWKFTSHAPDPGPMLFLDQVTVTNPGKAPGQVEMRLVLNGKPEENTVVSPIGPGDPATVNGVIGCNAMPAGIYTARLQILATGSTLIVDRSNEFALRPLVVPPTRPPV